jgi:hypothetical protein
MNSVQLSARVASQMLAPQTHLDAASRAVTKPPVALEIERAAPFAFAYTKVRLDTGEEIWRWPTEAPRVAGATVDVTA